MNETRETLKPIKEDFRWPWARGEEHIRQEGTSFWQRLREERGWTRQDVWELTDYVLDPAQQAVIEGDYQPGLVWEMEDLCALATLYGRAPGELLDASFDEAGEMLLGERLREEPEETESPPIVEVVYRNHRGEVATRRVTPLRVRFGSTEHHRTPQFLLEVFDHDRLAARTFALRDCDFDSAHY